MGRKYALTALLLAMLCAATLAAQNQATPTSGPMGSMSSMQMGHTDKPAPPAGPLKITFGDKSKEYTAAALAAMPQTTVNVDNSHAKASETYTGVPLIDLLTKLGVPGKPDGKQFRIYIVAAGSGGYEVTYSIGEVAPDVHDAVVIVADTENGQPIAADGPLKLVATREKRPTRWVRNPVAIRVLTAD
jgi:hypothetical protein